MPSSVTLADLRARALDYADMTGSSFPETSRLDDYINSIASELYDILVNSYEDYFLKQMADFDLVAGTEDYSLPTDFYKAKKVFYVSGGRRFTIPQFNLESMDGAKTSPVSGGTISFWYVPEMTLMASSGDSIAASIPPIVKGWPDFIALGAAIRLLIREESDPSALMRQKAEMQGRITSLAEPRDEGSQDRIIDVEHRWNTIGYEYDPGAFSLRYRIMGSKIKFIQYDVGY